MARRLLGYAPGSHRARFAAPWIGSEVSCHTHIPFGASDCEASGSSPEPGADTGHGPWAHSHCHDRKVCTNFSALLRSRLWQRIGGLRRGSLRYCTRAPRWKISRKADTVSSARNQISETARWMNRTTQFPLFNQKDRTVPGRSQCTSLYAVS